MRQQQPDPFGSRRGPGSRTPPPLRDQELLCHATCATSCRPGTSPGFASGRFEPSSAAGPEGPTGKPSINNRLPIAVRQLDDDGKDTGEKRICFRTCWSSMYPKPAAARQRVVKLTPRRGRSMGASHAVLIALLEERAHAGHNLQVCNPPELVRSRGWDPEHFEAPLHYQPVVSRTQTFGRACRPAPF